MADPVSLSAATAVLLTDGTEITLTPGTLGAVVDPWFTDPQTGQAITPGDVWLQWADVSGQAYAAPLRSVAAVKLDAPVGQLPPPPVPAVTTISPASGPTGTTVTVTGTGFSGATSVTFGTTPAASFTIGSDTQITAISPAGTPGTYDIEVTGPGGSSKTGPPDQFTET